MRQAGWPNDHFLPSDPLEILLCDLRFMNNDVIDIEETIQEIENLYELPELDVDWWNELIKRGTLLELVRRLEAERASVRAARRP
jgi:hypothetical protein